MSIAAIALGMMMSQPTLECPTCGEEVEPLTFHRACLARRCGGVVPEHIDKLAKEFDIADSSPRPHNEA